jgi:predicted transposase/invertase (TIGR01784 family)
VKTDTLFYQLFQAFPSIFFEPIGRSSADARSYQFSSIELKQVAFRIDGLFLPPDDAPNQPIYFVEVQFQKAGFYHRFFAEIFLYLHQYQPINDWLAVVVYAKRSLEQSQPKQYRSLLASEQVQRVYLDELGDSVDKLLGVGIVQLIVESKAKAKNRARHLVQKVRQDEGEVRKQEIVELIETIVMYKFPYLSRQEMEDMLGLSDLKRTKVYQEAKQEGKQEGKLEAVPKLLQFGLSVEQVAEALGLDIEQVRQAIKEQP